MRISLSGHTIKSVDDVIKTLVVDKELSLGEAFREYEQIYGGIPDIIRSNITYEHDHHWQIIGG